MLPPATCAAAQLTTARRQLRFAASVVLVEDFERSQQALCRRLLQGADLLQSSSGGSAPADRVPATSLASLAAESPDFCAALPRQLPIALGGEGALVTAGLDEPFGVSPDGGTRAGAQSPLRSRAASRTSGDNGDAVPSVIVDESAGICISVASTIRSASRRRGARSRAFRERPARHTRRRRQAEVGKSTWA